MSQTNLKYAIAELKKDVREWIVYCEANGLDPFTPHDNSVNKRLEMSSPSALIKPLPEDEISADRDQEGDELT